LYKIQINDIIGKEREMKTKIKKLNQVIQLEKGKLILLDEKEDIIKIITNVASQNMDILTFTMKTSKTELINEILASESSVNINKIKSLHELTDEDWNKLKDTIRKVLDFKLYIDDTQKNSIKEISNKCSKLKKEKNIKLVVIEYPQLVREDLETIKKFKELAKDLNITIVITTGITKKINEEQTND